MKKRLLFSIALLFIILLFFFSQNESPKINWNETYYAEGSNPLDTQIFHDQLNSIFKINSVTKIRSNFYEFHQKEHHIIQKHNQLYISIDDDFQIDESSEKKLLEFVGQGNIAFVSAHQFSNSLLKNLNVSHTQQLINNSTNSYITQIVKDRKFQFKPKQTNLYTYFKNTTDVIELGKINFNYTNNNSKDFTATNFIVVKYKNGLFYLHTLPDIFTNYHLKYLKSDQIISEILSRIPKKINQNDVSYTQHILINYKTKSDDELINDPLRFIKKNKELNAAWNLIIAGGILFILINIKRKQQITPTIKPLKNTSVEFIKTISSLYQDTNNHKDIIQHKIHYFLHEVNVKYNLKTDTLDENFIKKLSIKSNSEENNIRELINTINQLKNISFGSIELLIQLNDLIEKFHTNTDSWKN